MLFGDFTPEGAVRIESKQHDIKSKLVQTINVASMYRIGLVQKKQVFTGYKIVYIVKFYLVEAGFDP